MLDLQSGPERKVKDSKFARSPQLACFARWSGGQRTNAVATARNPVRETVQLADWVEDYLVENYLKVPFDKLR